MSKIFCMGEREYCSANDFVLDADQKGRLIHRVKQIYHVMQNDKQVSVEKDFSHYQATGDLVNPSAIDSLLLPLTYSYVSKQISAPDPYHDPSLQLPGFPQDADTIDKNGLAFQLAQKKYQSELDEVKARQDAMRQAIKDAQGSDYTSIQAINGAYLDVAKGQIDRAQARVSQVVTAASAIGTIYTAILALHFGGAGSSGTIANLTVLTIPLPSTGFIPGIFLGLAIFFALIYLAFITPRSRSLEVPKPSGIVSLRVIEQRRYFILWTSEIVRQRLSSLHASVLSLGFGVVFLPVAILNVSGAAWYWALGGVFIILLVSFVFLPLANQGRDKDENNENNSVEIKEPLPLTR
jgi:hypothetical protein